MVIPCYGGCTREAICCGVPYAGMFLIRVSVVLGFLILGFPAKASLTVVRY